MCASAVRLAGHLNGRDRALGELLVGDLGLELIQPAGTVFVSRARVLRHRVAALDDAVAHHAMEARAVEAALPRGLDEQRHVIRRLVGEQVPDNRPGRRLEHGLLRRLRGGSDRRDQSYQRGDERCAHGRHYRAAALVPPFASAKSKAWRTVPLDGPSTTPTCTPAETSRAMV